MKWTLALLAISLTIANAAGRPGRISRGFKRCGLPPFTEQLPEEQTAEVKKIWDAYKEGNDCEEEREQTQKVVDALPDDVRARIFRHTPPFLKNASAEVRKQFRDLMHDFSLTRADKKLKFRELAEKLLNKEQLDEFNKFEKEQEKRQQDFEDRVSKLSPKAKEAYNKLDKLKEQKTKVWREMSPDTRDELKTLFASRFRSPRKQMSKSSKLAVPLTTTTPLPA